MKNELQHYGVLGMRWHHRKNPSAAFAKSSIKADKLKYKSEKANRKVEKYTAKKTKYAGTEKEAKYDSKLTKAKSKAASKKAKADKWMNAMSDTFKKTTVSQITYEDLNTGKDYVPMLRKK